MPVNLQVPVNLNVKKPGIDRIEDPIDHLSDKQAAFALGFILLVLLLVLIAGCIWSYYAVDTADLQDAGQLVGP